MKPRIMYVENKSESLNGAARIGRVNFSKTGTTVYYRGRTFMRCKGSKYNHFDVDSGEHDWISGPQRDGNDRLYVSALRVEIDDDIRDEYWLEIRGKSPPATAR